MSEEAYCKKRVYGGSWGGSPCSRRAKRDGFCTQHHPDAVTARQRKSKEKHDADWAARKKRVCDEEARGEAKIQARIDAAVLAERERLEATDFWSVRCPEAECDANAEMPCYPDADSIHTERAIAAIRKPPEGSG